MATKTIGYANKVALNANPDVADINKVTDDDMNEIKEVVNNNAGEFDNTLPVILFEDANGDPDEITLDDNIANYKRIDIIANNYGILPVVSIFPQDNMGNDFRIVSSSWDPGILVVSKVYSCNGNKMTPTEMSSMFINANNTIQYTRSDLSQDSWRIAIHKVIGYKS